MRKQAERQADAHADVYKKGRPNGLQESGNKKRREEVRATVDLSDEAKAFLQSLFGDKNQLDRIERKLDAILRIEKETIFIMANLDDAIAKIAASETALDSLIEYNKLLNDQLKNAGVDQAKIDQVNAGLSAHLQKIADALVANVPPVTP